MTRKEKKRFWTRLLSALVIVSLLMGNIGMSELVVSANSNVENSSDAEQTEDVLDLSDESSEEIAAFEQSEKITELAGNDESIAESEQLEKVKDSTDNPDAIVDLSKQEEKDVALMDDPDKAGNKPEQSEKISNSGEVTENAVIENATIKEFQALLDQMEAFELTEENQEEYQALGMRAGELLEILMEDGYEGMEDDLIRFQALADKQTGGAEELGSTSANQTVYFKTVEVYNVKTFESFSFDVGTAFPVRASGESYNSAAWTIPELSAFLAKNGTYKGYQYTMSQSWNNNNLYGVYSSAFTAQTGGQKMQQPGKTVEVAMNNPQYKTITYYVTDFKPGSSGGGEPSQPDIPTPPTPSKQEKTFTVQVVYRDYDGSEHNGLSGQVNLSCGASGKTHSHGYLCYFKVQPAIDLANKLHNEPKYSNYLGWTQSKYGSNITMNAITGAGSYSQTMIYVYYQLQLLRTHIF